MPTLETGRAPQLSLKLMNSNQSFSLSEALRQGPVLAAFFKVSCPVCQLAFPYVQRMFSAYGNQKVSIVGVSQDSPSDTAAFAKRYGITFPIALDESGKYPASNAYGLTNVPTVFWISPKGDIELAIIGWDKREMERLNQLIAQAAGIPKAAIFKPGETVPDFKPG